MNASQVPLLERRLRAKRWFDIALVTAGLLPALITMVLCVAAVRLSSPGPVVFRQTRVGLHKEPFTCYKLRTMHVDTPNVPSHEASVAAVTPVGRWLRRLKFDELPQLWNVLRGDMSLVGPRPCLPSQIELIEARNQRGIYQIRPGITGISQVAGLDMKDPEKLAEFDAQYLASMSLKVDLGLILATVFGGGLKDRIQGDP